MPFALEEAAQTGSRLILLHVLSTGAGASADAVGTPCYDTTSAFEFAAKTLEAWRALALRKHIVCDVLVREGNPAQQVNVSSRQFKTSRIMLGTRSRSKLSKLFLGSVAEQVLRSVNLPVITVGPEAHLAVGSSDNEKVVLHATTLRETSRPSAVLACQIAASQHARLVLLHVLPPLDSSHPASAPPSLASAALRELQIYAAEASTTELGSCAGVETRVVHGNPAIEILATASEMRASLIILGGTERSALQNLTRDRTIYRVLAHALCPVLTLREMAMTSPQSVTQSVASYR